MTIGHPTAAARTKGVLAGMDGFRSKPGTAAGFPLPQPAAFSM
jgi:hypothetical protein